MADANSRTIYSENDYQEIRQQIKGRWIIIAIPCVLLFALVIWSFIQRIEWVTTTSTILLGVILIAAYDLTLKPLVCYRRHLDNVLHGRVRETTLPFVAISEDVNLVDGVFCRSLTCLDYDGKGRPYDRLFYFDALKDFPDFKEGDMLHIIHHDLLVADVHQV